MARKFKSKRRFSYKKTFKFLLIIFIVFMIYQIFEFIFLTVKLSSSKEDFINYIIEEENYYSYFERKNKNIITKIINYASNNIMKEPLTILESAFYYKDNKEIKKVIVQSNNTNEEKNNKEALVFIYNSHQTESYDMKYLEDYNITPTVLMASYILQEELNKKSIKSIVLEDSISDYLKEKNWKYGKSYDASRYFIEPIIKSNPNFKLIIDLHRDSATKEVSTTNIDNKSYAKLLFIVGQEHDNYKENLELANTLNNLVKEKYPSLTRGVMLKSGENVNGKYNQDLSNKMILIEVGSNTNNIEEVTNTLEILSEIIGEYINEKR